MVRVHEATICARYPYGTIQTSIRTGSRNTIHRATEIGPSVRIRFSQFAYVGTRDLVLAHAICSFDSWLAAGASFFGSLVRLVTSRMQTPQRPGTSETIAIRASNARFRNYVRSGRSCCAETRRIGRKFCHGGGRSLAGENPISGSTVCNA